MKKSISNRSKQQYIRNLRKHQTGGERALKWLILAGYRAQRQDPSGFVPDFYNRIARVALEVDGSIHRRGFKRRGDILRDTARKHKGIYTIRVSDKMARKHPLAVIIYAWLVALAWYSRRSFLP